MLHFLRNIRRKLLGSKVSSYLLYAIGEIVLVVVGILIAVQIDNWNERNKEYALEQSYYCRLLEDILQDEAKLVEVRHQTAQSSAYSNQLIAELQKPYPSQKVLANTLLGAITSYTGYHQPSTSAIDDIKSSGKLNIIKDIGLKNELTYYYAQFEKILQNLNSNNQSMDQKFFSNDNFLEIGAYEMGLSMKAFDSTVVDMKDLKRYNIISEQSLIRLKEQAVFFALIGARNLQHLEVLENANQSMKEILSTKCH